MAVEIHIAGVTSLKETLGGYLSLAQLSSFPLRSWSLMSEVFTATYVLTLLQLRTTSQDIDSLLAKFQRLLEQELAGEKESEVATYNMLQRGRKLLKLLAGSVQSSNSSGANVIHSSQAVDTETTYYDRHTDQMLGDQETSHGQSEDFETSTLYDIISI